MLVAPKIPKKMLPLILVILYIFVVLLFTGLPIVLVCFSIARSIGRTCLTEIEDMEIDIERDSKNSSDESYLLQLHC